MTTIMPCPFCRHDDVEICEVEPGRIAIDCPECECIGPFADSVDEAIAKWNAPHSMNLSLDAEVKKIRQWNEAMS